MTSRSPRQVRFLSATLQNASDGRCSVNVAIRGAAASYQGTAQGGCDEAEQLRCAAQATIDAMSRIGHRIKLDAVEAVSVLGEWTVALRVEAEHEGENRKLVGFCVAGNDVLKATVFALLNATNRFLEIG